MKKFGVIALLALVGACSATDGGNTVSTIQSQALGVKHKPRKGPKAVPHGVGKNGRPIIDGVGMDARWQKFQDAWHKIVTAKSPEEFEDAVNAHPLASSDKFWHGVANRWKPRGFQLPSPDCAVTQSYANNVSTIAIWIDGVDHTLDVIYSFVNLSSQNQFAAYDDTCTMQWSANLSNPVDGAISYSFDGNWLGLVDNGGSLQLFFHDGTFIDSDSAGGSTVWQTPWLASDESPLGFYFADRSGHLVKDTLAGPDMNGNYSLARAWSVTVGSGAAINNSPLVYGGFAFIGNDDGGLFIYDTAGNVKAGNTSMCVSTCATTDAVWSSPSLNLADGKFYFAVSNRVRMFTLDNTDGCAGSGSGSSRTCTSTVSSALNATATIQPATPMLDYQSSMGSPVYLYIPYRGRLYRMDPSNLSSINNVQVNGLGLSITTSRSNAFGTGRTLSCPLSSPSVWGQDGSGNWVVTLGDCDGYVSRFFSNASITRDKSQNAWVDGGVTRTCSKVDSTVLGWSSGSTKWAYFNCGLNTGTTSALIQMDPYSF